MATRSSPTLGPNVVQPYKIHVTQKYLDLTRQKLELTRLPAEPKHTPAGWDAGVKKSKAESLIDHWTEEYDWRAQESFFNDRLPQFRAPINGTRLHFVHKRSKNPNATPLLIAHGWPESFIVASKIIDALVDPASVPTMYSENAPSFHVVVPSIPGFGFSEPVPEIGNNMHASAEMFDGLMKGLGYSRYLTHGTGWGFRICRALSLSHPESCIGIHTVNPDIPAQQRPQLVYPQQNMNFAHNMAGMMMPPPAMTLPTQQPPSPPHPVAGERPQTIAYAICDSPAGLLATILDAIQLPSTSTSSSSASSPESYRSSSAVGSPTSVGTPSIAGRSPRSPFPANLAAQLELAEFEVWTPEAIINWTMFYWLPGPETSLRWLSNSTTLISSLWELHSTVPLGMTIYDETTYSTSIRTTGVSTPAQNAEAYHPVAMVRRRDGQTHYPAWERPGELVQDIREFARLLTQGPPPQPPPVAFTTNELGSVMFTSAGPSMGGIR